MKKALTVLFTVLALALVAIPASTAREQTPAGGIVFQTDGPDGCIWVAGQWFCF
jgi:hypothetical protein